LCPQTAPRSKARRRTDAGTGHWPVARPPWRCPTRHSRSESLGPPAWGTGRRWTILRPTVSVRPAPEQAQLAISTKGLSKDFGSGRGLFDLDLEIEEGEVFGFLGPNGAGKSTTMRLLMDLIRPSSGSASILGMDSHAYSIEIRRRIGYLPGDFALYPR